MNSYIITDKDNIINIFSKKNKIYSYFYILDLIIYKYKLFLDFILISNKYLDINEINNFKLSIINNNLVKKIIVYDTDNLCFIDLNSKQKINFYKYNYFIKSKTMILKKYIDQINLFKNNNNQLNKNNNDNKHQLNKDDNNHQLNIDNNNKQLNKDDENNIVKLEKNNLIDNNVRLKKEKIIEYKNKYLADINLYKKIKDNEEIPEIFINQYKILKVLDRLNLLYETKGFQFYYVKMLEIIDNNKLNQYEYMSCNNYFGDTSFLYIKDNN